MQNGEQQSAVNDEVTSDQANSVDMLVKKQFIANEVKSDETNTKRRDQANSFVVSE